MPGLRRAVIMLGYMRGAKKQENSVNALTLFLASRIRGRLVERIQPIVVLGARGPCAVAFLKLAFELISLAVHNGDSLRRSETPLWANSDRGCLSNSDNRRISFAVMLQKVSRHIAPPTTPVHARNYPTLIFSNASERSAKHIGHRELHALCNVSRSFGRRICKRIEFANIAADELSCGVFTRS